MVLKQHFILNRKTFLVPTIDAYFFNENEIEEFDKSSLFRPKVIDVHLNQPCTASCLYCFTQRGKADRYGVSQLVKKLRDSDLEEIARQFARLGGQTFFICSEGEPLFHPRRFLKVASTAVAHGLKVLTYTNAIPINLSIAKELYNLGVNLVVKLEGLNPEVNEKIIGSRGQYEYCSYFGGIIPRQLAEILEVYSGSRSKIAISSTLTALNSDQVQRIRDWSIDLGCAHFLKRMWIFGDAEKNCKILTGFDEQAELKKIYEHDSRLGFDYPMDVGDVYTLDIRRFLNNKLSPQGYPLRIFSHPRGGVYHSSSVVAPKFGFKDGVVLSPINSKGGIELEDYFRKIQEYIDNYARSRF